MQGEYEKINSLRIIRVAKNLNQEDFAKYFLCTKAYISSVEHGNKKMSLTTLRCGLNEINISTSDYFVLEELRDYLINMHVDRNYIYRCMLAKALGMVSPELKEQAESLVSEMLQKTPKHR